MTHNHSHKLSPYIPQLHMTPKPLGQPHITKLVKQMNEPTIHSQLDMKTTKKLSTWSTHNFDILKHFLKTK